MHIDNTVNERNDVHDYIIVEIRNKDNTHDIIADDVIRVALLH